MRRYWLVGIVVVLMGLGACTQPPTHTPIPTLPQTPEPTTEEPQIGVPPLPRLRTQGTVFVTETGQPWEWRGLSSFRLLHMLSKGEEQKVVEVLDWCLGHGITVVRVFSTVVNMFDLSPEAGRAALPQLLTLANARGIYVEVVGLADTAQRTYDHAAHLKALGVICGEFTNCLLEMANEPKHSTQVAALVEPSYLRGLRALVPSTVLCTLGTAANDEDRKYAEGADYMAVHFSRKDGDKGWRAVRHVKEGRDMAREVGKPVVDDEPAKETDPEKWRVKGMLTRVLGIPGTFHYQDGTQSVVPAGAIGEAFAAWQDGMNRIPFERGLTGTFQNAGHGAVVKEANFPTDANGDSWTLLRAYSLVGEHWGYAVLVGMFGDPKVRLDDGWTETGRTLWAHSGLVEAKR